MDFITCTYCRGRHTARYLGVPAKLLLDGMVQRGKSLDMPTLAFDEPVHNPNIGRGDGDVIVAQLVYQAALIPVAGVQYPAIVMTGRDEFGTPLPHWVHANTDDQLRASARLLTDMTELAISRAT